MPWPHRWMVTTLLAILAMLTQPTESHAELPTLIPRAVLFGNPEKASPTISPDGKLLAYLAPDDKGVLGIWVRSTGKTDDRLIEIAHGTWEGRLRDEIEQDDPETMRRWREAPETVRFDGGESLADVDARWRAFASAFAPDAPALVPPPAAGLDTSRIHEDGNNIAPRLGFDRRADQAIVRASLKRPGGEPASSSSFGRE